jgi:hypothetical protein
MTHSITPLKLSITLPIPAPAVKEASEEALIDWLNVGGLHHSLLIATERLSENKGCLDLICEAFFLYVL